MKIDQLTPETAMLQELGNRLARLRKQHGVTQIELAADAGIGVATIRRIEAGRDSQMESWLKILRSLNMTSAIDSFLPEHLASPRAEVLAKSGRQNARSQAQAPAEWGDENP